MNNNHDRRNFVKWSLAAGIPLTLGASPGSSFSDPADGHNAAGGQDEPSFFETVRTRRSVREFTPDPIPDEHLTRILDATRLAPTSGNQQPWKFLVVRDRTVIEELKKACVDRSLAAREARGMPVSAEVAEAVAASLQGYFSAPVFVVILTDGESQYPTYNHWDGPLAAGYLMLAARALGYGTVFITDSIPAEVTKSVLNIPDRFTRVCITPLGVPAAWPDPPEKKGLEEFVVYDRF